MRQTPLNERYLLSIREAADYFGIGEKKLRRLAENNLYPELFNRQRINTVEPLP